MALVSIPEEFGFNTEFPTWIIAYCVDADSWFCTNKRFFYYEYPMEFQSESAAIEYFRNNVPEFIKLSREMYPKAVDSVFLENTFERFVLKL